MMTCTPHGCSLRLPNGLGGRDTERGCSAGAAASFANTSPPRPKYNSCTGQGLRAARGGAGRGRTWPGRSRRQRDASSRGRAAPGPGQVSAPRRAPGSPPARQRADPGGLQGREPGRLGCFPAVEGRGLAGEPGWAAIQWVCRGERGFAARGGAGSGTPRFSPSSGGRGSGG